MSTTPEGKVKKAAHKIIDSYGLYRFMPVTGGFGVSGVFDEVVCINGLFLGIEYKSDRSKKPTELQNKNAKNCRLKGKGITLLIHKDNLDVLTNTIEHLLKYDPPSAKHNHWPISPVEPIEGVKIRKRK